jgi:hypothetical protein
MTNQLVRRVALKSRPRVLRRVPRDGGQGIRKSKTKARQRLMEKWSAERFAQHRRQQAEGSATRRRARQAAQSLLAESSRAEHERVVREERAKARTRQRRLRATKKRPTWRQACALLDKLAMRFDVPRVDKKKRTRATRALKYGTVGQAFTKVFIETLRINDRVRLVDVGSGIGLFVFLIALVTGATVHGVEIRHELHRVALKIGGAVRRECTRRGWLGVGKWKLVCGDAHQVLIDESLIVVADAADVDDQLFVSTFDDSTTTTTTTTTTTMIRNCWLSWCDIVFINNYALDDALTQFVLTQYGQRAPVDGRLVLLRNPYPRDRHGDVDSPLTLFETPTSDDVREMPADSVDWVGDERVHWAVLRVLSLGLRRRWFVQPAEKFRKMTPSILK